MKRIVIFCLFLSAGFATAADRFHAVEITDVTGNVTFEVLKADEYQLQRNECARLNRLLPKAISLARKKWDADIETRRTGFPASVISKLSVKSLSLFTTTERADFRVREAQADHDKNEAQRNAKKSSLERRIEQVRKDLPYARTRIQRNNVVTDLKELQKQLAKERAKEREHQEAVDRAVGMVQEFLGQLAGPSEKKTDS